MTRGESALAPAAFREPVVAYHAAVKQAAKELRVLVCEALAWAPTALDAVYAEDTHVMRQTLGEDSAKVSAEL